MSFSFKSSESTRQYQAFGAERNGIFYGKPSAFFAAASTPSSSTQAAQQTLPNTAGRPDYLNIGLAAGGLTIAAAAAFLRRRERLMLEAGHLDTSA